MSETKCESCIHENTCYYVKECLCEIPGFTCDEYKPLEDARPQGEWSGEPERRKMVTRVCTACGERSAVGYYCMWCGAYDGVSPRRDEKPDQILQDLEEGIANDRQVTGKLDENTQKHYGIRKKY